MLANNFVQLVESQSKQKRLRYGETGTYFEPIVKISL